MLDFLNSQLKNDILKSLASVYEIRLRANSPIFIKGSDGLNVLTKRLNVTLSKKDIEQIVLRLCNHSVFSAEDSLKMGFITSKCGERVGICGEVVQDGDDIKTIKNFSSLTIRFPNVAFGCSDVYVKSLSNAKSCLVVSPPFHGKTTFIRDLGRAYCDHFNQNVLFVDERDELSGGGAFFLGSSADVLRFSTKEFGFINGVRAYNPDVIISDELMSNKDLESVYFAKSSGVKIVASTHSDNIENLLKKQNISKIIKSNTFEDIIFLKNFKIEKIYEEKDWLKYL